MYVFNEIIKYEHFNVLLSYYFAYILVNSDDFS